MLLIFTIWIIFQLNLKNSIFREVITRRIISLLAKVKGLSHFLKKSDFQMIPGFI